MEYKFRTIRKICKQKKTNIKDHTHTLTYTPRHTNTQRKKHTHVRLRRNKLVAVKVVLFNRS